MKKLALILAFLVIPCASFGLEMMNDNAMDQVTGQSGVSIAFDDLQMFINIEKLAYIDCDGFNSHAFDTVCEGAAGAIGLNNFQIDVLNINAIVNSTANDLTGNNTTTQTNTNVGSMPLFSTSCGNIDLFYDYGTAGLDTCYLGSASNPTADNAGLNNYTSIDPLGSGRFIAKALTIDVTDDLPALSAGIQNNLGQSTLSVGGVLIGVPTMEIYINGLTLRPFYTGDVNGLISSAVNNNADFGVIAMEGITFTTLSGWVEIAPH